MHSIWVRSTGLKYNWTEIQLDWNTTSETEINLNSQNIPKNQNLSYWSVFYIMKLLVGILHNEVIGRYFT